MPSPSFVLVTGATGGLGFRTVHALARRGTSVVVGGRRQAAVEALCADLTREHGVEAVPFVADLADLDQVRSALNRLAGLRFRALITNAGLTTLADARTQQGFELTFGVNVLAHQVVLARLVPQLEEGGRIIVLSSGVHEPDNQLARRAGIPVPRWVGTQNLAFPDDAEPEKLLEPGPLRYSTSKLGNVLQARGWQRHLREQNRAIDVFAVDPGLMVDTQLAREIPWVLRPLLQLLGRILTPFVSNMRLSTTTAAILVRLVHDPAFAGSGFQYFDGDHPKAPSADAQREDLMDDVWHTSAQLLEGYTR